jgi:catechol 2,3-dioxygenase-like lactoylglutathione lyase family enzyme
MINSVIHHIGIGLRDPRSAKSFFDQLFTEFLGLAKETTTEAVAGWKGRGTRFYIYPLAAGEAPGSLQHLAFSARSRTEVDRFCEWAAQHRVRITSGPKSYPEYERDYYAVFFAGPENLRFEFVHLPEVDEGTPLNHQI